MAIPYDIHMHSSFSEDSDTPMQEMVSAAMKKGLSGICFTEHMDLEYPPCSSPANAQAFEADPDAEYKEILRLRSLHPSIRIGFGLEFGMQERLSGRFHEIAARFPLDFILASQHLVGRLDPYFPEAWEGRTRGEMVESYYTEMLSNLKTMQDWDSLAHMDYIIRYIPDRKNDVYDSMRYHGDVIDEILRYVIAEGKCLEVNTAGYRHGLGQPNPSPAILKRYRELGGRYITVGADAHKPEQIAYAYDQALRLLRSLGFDTVCVFEGRRMRELQLFSISS